MTIATPSVRNMNDPHLWLLLLIPTLCIVVTAVTAHRVRRKGDVPLQPLLEGDTPEGDRKQS